jgi:hypothetical protein
LVTCTIKSDPVVPPPIHSRMSEYIRNNFRNDPENVVPSGQKSAIVHMASTYKRAFEYSWQLSRRRSAKNRPECWNRLSLVMTHRQTCTRFHCMARSIYRICARALQNIAYAAQTPATMDSLDSTDDRGVHLHCRHHTWASVVCVCLRRLA